MKRRFRQCQVLADRGKNCKKPAHNVYQGNFIERDFAVCDECLLRDLIQFDVGDFIITIGSGAHIRPIRVTPG